MSLEVKLKLVKYRDAQMSSYTYFYTDESGKIISPFFDSDIEAEEWLKNREGTE
jgi:hypothetical protein